MGQNDGEGTCPGILWAFSPTLCHQPSTSGPQAFLQVDKTPTNQGLRLVSYFAEARHSLPASKDSRYLEHLVPDQNLPSLMQDLATSCSPHCCVASHQPLLLLKKNSLSRDCLEGPSVYWLPFWPQATCRGSLADAQPLAFPLGSRPRGSLTGCASAGEGTSPEKAGQRLSPHRMSQMSDSQSRGLCPDCESCLRIRVDFASVGVPCPCSQPSDLSALL